MNDIDTLYKDKMLQHGTQVYMDNNKKYVYTVVSQTPRFMFTKICDDKGMVWDVMTNRLTKINDYEFRHID